MKIENLLAELHSLTHTLSGHPCAMVLEAARYIEAQEHVITDQRRLTREMDMALNGENAAEQASLCDLVQQVQRSDPRQPIGYMPAYILQRAKMGRTSPIDVALSLTPTDDHQLAVYCGPAGEDAALKHLEELVNRVLEAAGEDWQDVDQLPDVVRKLRNRPSETPSKGAEPAHRDEAIHALALSVERLTRQFEPIITSDRITGMDANALEVLERAREMDWTDDGAVAEVEPLTVRECIIQALEFISHSALGHDIGHLVHFANKAEGALRQAIDLLDEEAAARGAS